MAIYRGASCFDVYDVLMFYLFICLRTRIFGTDIFRRVDYYLDDRNSLMFFSILFQSTEVQMSVYDDDDDLCYFMRPGSLAMAQYKRLL